VGVCVCVCVCVVCVCITVVKNAGIILHIIDVKMFPTTTKSVLIIVNKIL